SEGPWIYTYDQEGTLTKKSKGASAEPWTYGYDNLNRLVWAKHAATDGGTTNLEVDYKYDPLGNRIERDYDDDGAGPDSPAVTKYAIDRQQGWADTSSTGSLQMRRLDTTAGDAGAGPRESVGGGGGW